MGTATFPWLTAMLAIPQDTGHKRICTAVALDSGCRHSVMRVGRSIVRRGTRWDRADAQVAPGRRAGQERTGLDDLRSQEPRKLDGTRSRERCARGTALPGALGRLSCSERITRPSGHLLRWGTPAVNRCACSPLKLGCRSQTRPRHVSAPTKFSRSWRVLRVHGSSGTRGSKLWREYHGPTRKLSRLRAMNGCRWLGIGVILQMPTNYDGRIQNV